MILQLQRRRLEQAQELRVILENVSSEPALDVRAVFVKRLVLAADLHRGERGIVDHTMRDAAVRHVHGPPVNKTRRQNICP